MKSNDARYRIMGCIAFKELYDKVHNQHEATARGKVGITKAQERMEKTKKLNEAGMNINSLIHKIIHEKAVVLISLVIACLPARLSVASWLDDDSY